MPNSATSPRSDTELDSELFVTIPDDDMDDILRIADNLANEMNARVNVLTHGGRCLSIEPVTMHLDDVRELLAERGYIIHA